MHSEGLLTQFDDDNTILLDGTDQSLNGTLNAIHDFLNFSGLNVNFDKTNVVWIGKNKYSSNTIKTKWKLNWMQHSFKMLGINFDVDLSKIFQINYNEKIVKMENILKELEKMIFNTNWKECYCKNTYCVIIQSLGHISA